MFKELKLVVLGVLIALGANAQSVAEPQFVSLNYKNETLGYILNDISEDYGVQFSYSSDAIAVKKKLSLRVDQTSLDRALTELCDVAELKYAKIGGQMVLKAAPKPVKAPERKVEKITHIEVPKLPKSIKQQTPLYQEDAEEEQRRYEALAFAKMNRLETKQINSIPGGERVVVVESQRFESLAEEILEEDEKIESDNRLAQISIFSRVGTNSRKSDELTNNLSVNLFWGANGGVDGLEVGGVFNHIKNDVRGIQAAGIGNHVNNNVIGTQASGVFNIADGKVEGVQASGIFNIAKEATAIQASGLFNIASNKFSGLQVAPLFNYAGPGSGVQVSSLLNVNRGKVKTQISGLMNVAGDVDYAQISPFLNIAKKVSGFQFGIINVADTVSGVPLGMLTLVKKGYNRVDFFASESMLGNFALKLGAKSFYNIFQIGARWDEESNTINGNTEKNTLLTWGLGYGMGTAIKLNRKSLLNIEAIGMHVNEGERWTSELNILTQLRILADVRIGHRTSIFAGPSGNIMFSNLYDADSNTYGSNIMPYSLYDETINGTNIKMWIGFIGGIRF